MPPAAPSRARRWFGGFLYATLTAPTVAAAVWWLTLDGDVWWDSLLKGAVFVAVPVGVVKVHRDDEGRALRKLRERPIVAYRDVWPIAIGFVVYSGGVLLPLSAAVVGLAALGEMVS